MHQLFSRCLQHPPQAIVATSRNRLIIIALSLLSLGQLQAQTPGNGNLTGMPPVNDNSNVTNNGATLIQANADGSAIARNEYLYFKVRPWGAGNTNTNDWYSDPTAWMEANDFHFKNLNLRMYDNFVRFNNAPKNRRILFDQDTWSNDDYQFTGLGSTNNNDLRYQTKDATKSHLFFAGLSAASDKQLLTINGDGRIQVPTKGLLEFGSDLPTVNPNMKSSQDTYKEINAGRIGYQLMSKGLDIVGAGQMQSGRKIKLWAEGGALISGKLVVDLDTVPTTLPGGIDLSSYKLFVSGGILAKEVRVRAQWADYVFSKEYRLRPLDEVESFINHKGHLPNMPAAREVEQEGLSLGDVVRLQQEKIEELTLYLIQMKKEVDALKSNSVRDEKKL